MGTPVTESNLAGWVRWGGWGGWSSSMQPQRDSPAARGGAAPVQAALRQSPASRAAGRRRAPDFQEQGGAPSCTGAPSSHLLGILVILLPLLRALLALGAARPRLEARQQLAAPAGGADGRGLRRLHAAAAAAAQAARADLACRRVAGGGKRRVSSAAPGTPGAAEQGRATHRAPGPCVARPPPAPPSRPPSSASMGSRAGRLAAGAAAGSSSASNSRTWCSSEKRT